MPRKKKTNSNAQEVQNAAKTLFANIRFMSPDNPVRSLVLTSSVPNEGKTRTSYELAKAIATSGKSVVLVDADMRRRSLAALIEVHPESGLYAVLSDEVPLRNAVVETQVPNLFFLDCEPGIPNPADVISSKRFLRLTYRLTEAYDYVIYDTPPLGAFVDSAILSTLVDGTILVVKPGTVKRSELADSYDQLQKAGANVLGICATFCETSSSDYYYAYYTKDGVKVDPSEGRDVIAGLNSEPVKPAVQPSPMPASRSAAQPAARSGQQSSIRSAQHSAVNPVAQSGQRVRVSPYAAPVNAPRGAQKPGRGRTSR